MPRNDLDLAGQRFGHWTVMERDRSSRDHSRWFCLCDCGEWRSVKQRLMLIGRSLSCGCRRREQPLRELQDLGFGVHLVPLTRGKFALIDSADAEQVGKHNWHARKCGSVIYAARSAEDGSGRKVFMHRQLVPGALLVDHVNGDSMDNRRENLRLATKSQNNMNVGVRRDNTSGYKGVSLHKLTGKWSALISCNGRSKYLGLFNTPEEAHAAYCKAARELHGDFARTA